MALRETDAENIVIGSIWKYISENKPGITSNDEYQVVKVNSDTIGFGDYFETQTGPSTPRYAYSKRDFLLYLVELKDPLARTKTQFSSIIAPLLNCFNCDNDIHDLIVELEI